jgi:hemoglobin-like flavoprotein
MTADDIRLVQESWHKIEFVQEIAADLFYTRLFELDPDFRQRFGDDPRTRSLRFASFLQATVRGLGRLDALLPIVRALGIKHPVFAADERQHANVAQALFWSLEKGLRGEFTPQVKSAWIATYGVLSRTMREAGVAPRSDEQAAA